MHESVSRDHRAVAGQSSVSSVNICMAVHRLRRFFSAVHAGEPVQAGSPGCWRCCRCWRRSVVFLVLFKMHPVFRLGIQHPGAPITMGSPVQPLLTRIHQALQAASWTSAPPLSTGAGSTAPRAEPGGSRASRDRGGAGGLPSPCVRRDRLFRDHLVLGLGRWAVCTVWAVP